MAKKSPFAGVFRNAMQSFGMVSYHSDWSMETVKTWCDENKRKYAN